MTHPATAGDFLRHGTGSSDRDGDTYNAWCNRCSADRWWKFLNYVPGNRKAYECETCHKQRIWRQK